MIRRSLTSVSALFVATIGSLALAGCGMNSLGTGGSLAPTAAGAAKPGGQVHGGNQPVSGATVKLWAAGTTGTYGTGATLVATTTSDALGNFTFNNIAGVSPCTTGQYLYVTAVGGNPGAGVNPYSAMMAVIGSPCTFNTGQYFIDVNEITTVAAVWARQQFMSIAPGATVPWQIGAPATNVTGLANAFLMTTNLAGLGGNTNAQTVTSVVGATTFTTTVTPDFKKINTLGNILAYCVNSTGAQCSALFNDTTPTGSTPPVDTIQASYYIATNPAGLTMTQGTAGLGEPYYLCNAYVPSAGAPFATGLTCTTTSYPTDWTINVSFKTVNGTTAATVGTVAAGNVAIDANGNIWTAAYGSSGSLGSIVEFNVLGQVLVGPVTTVTAVTGGEYPAGYSGSTPYTLGGAKTMALAIDTSNNAWYAGFYDVATTDSLNTIYASEVPLAQISQAGIATGYLVGLAPGALAIDSSNNLFMNAQPTSGRYYLGELQAAGTPAYSNFYPGAGRGTGYYNQIVVDQTANQNFYAFSNACNAVIISGNNATETALGNTALPTTNIDGTVTVALTSTAPTTCAEFGAVDATNNLWGGGGTYLEYINVVGGTVTGTAPAVVTNTPIVTQFASGTGFTQGGLDNVRGVAIDGLGHVWVGNQPTSTTGCLSEFAVNNAGATPTITALSPAGTSTLAVFGFGSQNGYSTVVQPVLDASGNVWVATQAGSFLNVMVGAAAPVVTPIATQISKGAIGVRP